MGSRRGSDGIGVRAALYHRVSTADQDPALARDELRAAARQRSMHIVLDVEEKGSGARNDRPGLQRVLAAAQAGEIDAVIVWKMDRFARSALDLLTNIRMLEDAGVRFIAHTQSIDLRSGGDAMSRMIVTVLAAIAEFERDLIRERTRLGLDKARKAGTRIGRPIDACAPSATAVAKLRAAGASWSQVAARLGCHASAARRAIERANS